MKSEILKHLDQIETDHRVRIILACESGSRAWGFPSKDSDYDVRFIYVRTKNDYLSIAGQRDVIELPINNELDINGWDLKKALWLMRQSNAPLLEWLSSPIQYLTLNQAVDPMVELAEKTFIPRACFHHYLSMAKSFMNGLLHQDHVKAKTYMYALRPVLCCQWIVKSSTRPPMLMDELVSLFLSGNRLEQAIRHLIRDKQSQPEAYMVKRDPLLDGYLKQQVSALEKQAPEGTEKLSIEAFDHVFRGILDLLSV